jgi:HlyD family secretion protein
MTVPPAGDPPSRIQSIKGFLMKKKIFIITILLTALVVTGLMVFGGSKDNPDGITPDVKVTRGNIVEKALAVGTIEPENEISVKSKVSGVVKRIFADAGTFVRTGQPLLEVRPDPTPIELADAKRQVQLAQVEVDNLKKDMVRQVSMNDKGLISSKEFEESERKTQEAELRLTIAKERLALFESGKVTIDDTEIESIIKAPIDGYVLNKSVEVGDPVTPLTSYQEGTVLMKMANMGRLLFKGTVDEIDVGKLKEGMPVEIKVGALPNDTVKGTVRKISLKAEKRENATIFPIEIMIPASANTTLRAGYSANANIIIQRKEHVLTLPERTITFRNDSAFVLIPKGEGRTEEKFIKTGLSDAISVEILSGLAEGDQVAEKPAKKIE